MTTALIFHNLQFYVFDSHSQNHLGKISENGTSVMLKFMNIHDVQNYIYETFYGPETSKYKFMYFQFHLVQVTCAEHTEMNFYTKTITHRKNNITGNTGTAINLISIKRDGKGIAILNLCKCSYIKNIVLRKS